MPTAAEAAPAPAVTASTETLPAVAVGETAPVAQAKLAQIQAGIQNILQAGGKLLTSQKTLLIRKGDTLMDVLVRNKVSKADAHDAIAALSKVYNPRDLNPAHAITVFFHQDPAGDAPTFSGLEIKKDAVNTVVLSRDAGRFSVGAEQKEVVRETKAYRGTINSSLYVSAKAAGVPDAVILDLIKMYSWNVDFQRDLQSGDTFEVMFEDSVTEDGERVRGRGVITYAKLNIGGSDMAYYRYVNRAGVAEYYDETGRSAKKSLMKTPIDGARISSGFGMRRHPVMGYSKMHKGIDFAAPIGTPIYAAGDGKIVKMGPFSSYGNYIRIAHNNGFETAYAHMKGFKAGLRAGARVKQGEIIGYVGNTGRSTGAHLHYEIMAHGTQVNPSSVKTPTGNQLSGRDMVAFKTLVGQSDRQFAKINVEGPAVASIEKPAAEKQTADKPAQKTAAKKAAGKKQVSRSKLKGKTARKTAKPVRTASR